MAVTGLGTFLNKRYNKVPQDFKTRLWLNIGWVEPTDYGHPERAFFQKYKFLGLDRQIGLKFYEAFLGYFWPNYKHYFSTVSPLSIGNCIWFSFLQKTLVFRSKTYNSQMLPK